MPIYVSLARSWSELYTTDELQQVRKALELGELHEFGELDKSQDWQTFTAGRIDDPPWFRVPDDEREAFTSSLTYLCDKSPYLPMAGATVRLEFIPHVLLNPLEPAAPDPSIGSWRIYSAAIMAMRWLTNFEDHTEFEELALLYRWEHGLLNDRDNKDELELLDTYYEGCMLPSDREDELLRARAYYIKRLGDLADVGRRASVPGFVRW